MICRALNNIIKKSLRKSSQDNNFANILPASLQEVMKWYNNENQFWTSTIYDILIEKYVSWVEDCKWNIFSKCEIIGKFDLRNSLQTSESKTFENGWNCFVSRFNSISIIEIKFKNNQIFIHPVVRIKKISNLLKENYSEKLREYFQLCEEKFAISSDPMPDIDKIIKNGNGITFNEIFYRLQVLSKPFEQSITSHTNVNKKIFDSAYISLTNKKFQLYKSITQEKLLYSIDLKPENKKYPEKIFSKDIPINIVIDPCLIGGEFAPFEEHTFNDLIAGNLNLELALLIKSKLEELNDQKKLLCNVFLTRNSLVGAYKDNCKFTDASLEEIIIRASNHTATVSYILPLIEQALFISGDNCDSDQTTLVNVNRSLNASEYHHRVQFINSIEGGTDIFLSIYFGLDNITRDKYNYTLYLPGCVCIDEMRNPGHKEHLCRMLCTPIMENSTNFAEILATNLENNYEIPTKDPNVFVGSHSEDKEIVQNLVIPAHAEDKNFPIFHRNLRTLRLADAKVSCYAELFDLKNSQKSSEFLKKSQSMEMLANSFIETILTFYSEKI